MFVKMCKICLHILAYLVLISFEITCIRSNEKCYKGADACTVFPHIRHAGIIFLQGLQLRVLFEGWYHYQNFIKPEVFIAKIAHFLHEIIKKHK